MSYHSLVVNVLSGEEAVYHRFHFLSNPVSVVCHFGFETFSVPATTLLLIYLTGCSQARGAILLHSAPLVKFAICWFQGCFKMKVEIKKPKELQVKGEGGEERIGRKQRID